MEIICKDLSKSIKIKKGLFKFEKISVLKNLNYSIKQGEIIALMGAFNSGKSTFVNVLSGKSCPDNGVVLVDGENSVQSLKENSAVIGDFYNYKFKEGESVYNSLAAYAKKINVNELDAEKRIVDLKNALDFERVINKKISELDEVSKIKIRIALSMLNNPSVIYFDGALMNLDVITKNLILKDLKRINKEFKTTIIITSVDFMDIEKICKRISILKDGVIAVDGDFESIKNKYFNNKIIGITFNKNVSVPKGNFEIVDSSDYFLKLKVDFSKCDFASIIGQFDINTIVDINIASSSLI